MFEKKNLQFFHTVWREENPVFPSYDSFSWVFLSCVPPLLSTQNTSFLTRLAIKCVDFPPHQAIIHTSWVSYSLTQFWHCLGRGTIKSHKIALPPPEMPTGKTCASDPPAVN